MSPSPIERYRALLNAGQLRPDKTQARAAQALEFLYRSLKAYRPRPRRIFRVAFGSQESSAPKGLYIHGDVGRGKSALMDMFFESAPTARKRRVHFNQFMTDTHQRIHEWRNLSQEEKSRRPEFIREAEDDPIAPVAKAILSEARLLCLDEFQVNDVADAMILGRLFEKLLGWGAVIVLTSNTEPDHLYEDGLNRQLFLPFIALIKERLEMI